jgi:DNA-binding transcriptional LysR family regulator
LDTISGINSFIKAVELGSIAAAARQLGITSAAASQNIARLELYVGVRLLTRTTRRLALTESGAVYYAKVSSVLHQLDMAKSAVSDLHGIPQGRLRVATSTAFGRHIIAPLIPEFYARYPAISFELISTDLSINHIQDEIDISIRFRQQIESHLISRHLMTVPMVICASPAYLQGAGVPSTPEQLSEHACLLYRIPTTGLLMRWGFLRDGIRFEPDIEPAIISNDIGTLAQLAVGGAGIVRLGSFIAGPLIENGQLQAIFNPRQNKANGTRTDAEPLEFHVCYRDRHEVSLKMRVFIDFLVEKMPRIHIYKQQRQSIKKASSVSRDVWD